MGERSNTHIKYKGNINRRNGEIEKEREGEVERENLTRRIAEYKTCGGYECQSC